MKRSVVAVLAGLVGVPAALAANLNVTVTANGTNNITVPPGCVLTYSVSGQLSDANNEGLALVGFDLDFSGGALVQAMTPTTVPMNNFVSPLGINNPAGYGGTIIDGNLVQVGGGQNTIKNVVSNAPFPIGDVIPGVAHTPVVLVQGQVTAPAAPGAYTLSVLNLFANQIKDGETGTVFWATEACGVGSISNLTINVQNGATCPGGTDPGMIVSSVPANNSIDARQPANLVGGCVDTPGFTSIDITFQNAAAGLTAGDFTVTVEPAVGPVPGISNVAINGNTATLTLNQRIPPGRWTRFTFNGNGSSTRIGFLPADVNGDRTAGPIDILKLIDHLNGIENFPITRTDIDRSGVANPSDILREIDLLNGADCYDPWNGVTLP